MIALNVAWARARLHSLHGSPKANAVAVVTSPLRSVENPSPDLNSRLGRKLVYGGDGYLIAELTKGSRQHLGTLFLFPGTHFAALLDISHPFMQDLPNYATEPMGNGPDGGLIAEPGHQTAEHHLKITAFLRDRSVRGLVQNSTH